METVKKVKDMTDKELIQEWNDISFHIRNLGVGRYELHYQAELERELNKRGTMY